MFEICSKKDCTGCRLCENSCPKKAITLKKDKLGVSYPIIDKDKCISCHICQNNCPVNQKFKFKYPNNAYVGWSNSIDTRNKGASGGIAQELYQYAIDNGYSAYGVAFFYNDNDDVNLEYIKVKNSDDINNVAGSKYVHANLHNCLELINQDIKDNKKVLFIGTPCQCAAVKKKFSFMKKEDNLILIDIVCHGVAPISYLQQHLKYIEKKHHKKANKITFRNPNSSYYFSLYDNNGKLFYRKNPNQTDIYFRGYMNNLILRENCYSCHYAKESRITDITLADFNNRNIVENLNINDHEQLNLILSSTDKGQKILDHLVEKHKITLSKELDIEQAIKNNKQLHFPTLKNKNRFIFEKKYIEKQDFEFASNFALKKELFSYRLLFIPNLIKVGIIKIFPRKLKNEVKKRFINR